MDNQILAMHTFFQSNILLFTSAIFSQPVKAMPTFTYTVASFTNITENIFDAEE